MAKQLSIILAVLVAFAPFGVGAQERNFVVTIKGVAPQTPVHVQVEVIHGHGIAFGVKFTQIKVGPGDVRFSKVGFLGPGDRVVVRADAYLGEDVCRNGATVVATHREQRPVTIDFSGCHYSKRR